MATPPPPPPAVAAYLDALPDDRRAVVRALRDTIAGALPPGYEEGIQYGMIGYYVPHDVYAHGYHCDPKQPVPFASVASQKNHVGLYLFCVYLDSEQQSRFAERWQAGGRKLDMGKGCVRIKKTQFEQIPHDVVAETIAAMPVADFLARYEAGLPDKVKKKRGLL